MDVLKSLIILAVGITCVYCQNTDPASNPNARTLATGGTEFVVTGGGNQPSGGSGSLLDIALASFGTSAGGPANPNPPQVDPNQPPQTQPVGSGNFVDAVNNLLSTGTSQMDPNVLTNLGLPTEQNTQNTQNTQPMNPVFQNNPGPMPPNDPSLNTGLIGVPFRDPNSVPISDPNAGPVPGPVSSGPVGDPNAIGGGLVMQIDPQNGMNRGPAFRGDTAAVQYSSAGSIPQTLFDPNTARNVVDRNVPLPSGSVFELTGQPQPGMSQPGIYPTMSTGGNTMMPQGGPNSGGPLNTVSGGPLSTVSGSAGEPLSMGSAGGPLSRGSAGEPFSMGSAGGPLSMGSAGEPFSMGSAGGPLSMGSAGGPLSMGSAGGPISMGSAGANAGGSKNAVFGATGSKPMNSPLFSGSGGRPVLGVPPSGGILSTLKNNGMPGVGMPSGPLAAMKANSVAHTKKPAQDNGMMDMLIMSMIMGGGEMNPALLMMAMGSMGGGGGGGMSALPLIMSMSGM